MTMKQVRRVERGPIKGAPPSLEWVAVERLEVDPAYQRAVEGEHSRRIINGMVREWDWALCQPLVVSRRADGRLFILDGQHRHSGAIERGDVLHLPCVLVQGCDLAGEASAFVALNTRRQRLSQSDIFNGMLAAGDPDAVHMAGILEQTGWRQGRGSGVATYRPGTLICAPMLVKALRINGEAPVRNALASLREAYADKVVQNASSLLKALILIYRGDDLDGIDPDLFVETLGSIDPGDWDDFAREEQRQYPVLSRIESMARAMVHAACEAALEDAA